MTACDLYHGWFYHQGALRLASTLGWGLQMLKEDARRKKLREASDRLEQAWANLASQTSVLAVSRASCIARRRSSFSTCSTGSITMQPGEYWTSLDVSQRLEQDPRSGAAHFRMV